MNTDEQAWRDLTKLARDRCRAQVMSVSQLVDNRDQLIALLVNVAADLLAGAAEYMQDDNHTDDGQDVALYLAVLAVTHALGKDKITAGGAKYLAGKLWQKDHKTPQPDGVSASKSNPKNG